MRTKHTGWQMALEIAALLLLVGMFGLLLDGWDRIPAHIPIHYDAWGRPDLFSEKTDLIFLPLVGLFLYAMLSLLVYFPSLWNLPERLTRRNPKQVYSLFKTGLLCIKAETMALFFYLTIQNLLPSLLAPYTVWVLIAFLVCSVGTMTATLIVLHKKK